MSCHVFGVTSVLRAEGCPIVKWCLWRRLCMML